VCRQFDAVEEEGGEEKSEGHPVDLETVLLIENSIGKTEPGMLLLIHIESEQERVLVIHCREHLVMVLVVCYHEQDLVRRIEILKGCPASEVLRALLLLDPGRSMLGRVFGKLSTLSFEIAED
jgi:hypothetical protein